ncbi:BON domain-containing protein [Magnetospirillum sulfuroxidans]|uniref:BON domain-containing protein n=1 Tax=Magnetospirillum sulfuroxidans TaxID=611300 RepID=A0ABS5I8N4_9PROT|nr:BON domain-containing protein [Magnetospirillum sulfuroxidans]MBR9970621.1 BON domain-containing protein [Magnetospirillum sulfuroxidans]
MRSLLTASLLVLLTIAPAQAQLMDVLTAPKTLFDRAIEARSAGDIAKDNEIVVKVNGIMGKLATIKASTEIYEQRLLITGIFDDKALYDRFERDVRQVQGIKKLYWHVTYLAKDDAKRKALLDWADVTVMATKAQGRLVGTAGVADVNFRTTTDAYGTVYLLGRARSGEEAKKALARVRDGNGVKKVVNYTAVRP